MDVYSILNYIGMPVTNNKTIIFIQFTSNAKCKCVKRSAVINEVFHFKNAIKQAYCIGYFYRVKTALIFLWYHVVTW